MDATNERIVRLYCAPLPPPLSRLAVHSYFTVLDPGSETWERWEVWQNRSVVPASWGYVHQNLMAADGSVGGGPSWVVGEWRGEEAERIAAVLRQPERYPYRERYRYWPGPNSNTFAAWILREAGIMHRLDRRALGKNFPRPY